MERWGDRAYGMYLSAGTNTVTVEVKNSTITNYDKNGIEVMGDKLAAGIHDNTIIGRGPTDTGDEVQNGVNIGRSAVGTVNANTINSMSYSPLTYWSAGVLVVTGGSADVTNNTIEDCQYGVMFDDSNGKAQGNTVAGGEVGLIGLWAQYYKVGTWTATFIGNTVTAANDAAGYENAAIGCQTWDENASVTFMADDNILTGNVGTTADGIYIGDVPANDPAGNIKATITNNTVSGWQHGVYLASSVAADSTITGNTITNNVSTTSGIHIEAAVNAANVSANFNNIVGNVGFGINNEGTGTLNAINNWWGANNGPSGVGPGSGDAVSANVDYDPWLGAELEEAKSETVTGSGTVTDTATGGSITIDATGDHTITTAKYVGNPGGTPTFTASGNYYDVHLDSAVGVNSLTIEFCPATASTVIYYWNSTSWVVASNQAFVNGCIRVTITAATTPSLADLTGAVFASGTPPSPPPPPPPPPPKPRVSPTPPRPLNPAQLSLRYLSVNPQQTSANQPVTITTNVVNGGDQAGNYNVALTINGQMEQQKMVSVGPQGTQPVKFTVTKAQPGTYTVDIGGQRGSFVVLGAGGTAGAPMNGGLIAILIIGLLVIATVVVLLFRRFAS